MKKSIKFISGVAFLSLAAIITSCNDYLDITPPSSVTPETYFNTADQLGAYTIRHYTGYYSGNDYNSNDISGRRSGNIFPHHGIGGSSYESYFDDDMGTDNECAGSPNSAFYEGKDIRVAASGGEWSFSMINAMNYFFEQVLPKREKNEIKGDSKIVDHYIGEAYVIRASEYFKKLKALGDFPIVTTTLPMDQAALIEASKRSPRNKVARFILSDLDKAIELLTDGTALSANRISKDAALLLKARVALYEATFEKYFAGTPFVPDRSAGWPGAKKSYNDDFTYDNAAEVSFFLEQALSAAKLVADNRPLATNNKKVTGETCTGMAANPYYDMFASKELTNNEEAIMYRSYSKDVAGGSCMNQYIRGGRGFTQEFANAFLMNNGLPIYDVNSGYKGDDFIQDTRTGRDYRWQLFTKAPGDYLYEGDSDQRIGALKTKSATVYVPVVYSGPAITTSTGYHKGKGWSKNASYSKGGQDETAAIVFRAAEAYLIYIEAAWEKYGDGLNSDAWQYWGKLRERAGLPKDAQVTIMATDLDKEEVSSHDFGLYSAGQRLTSKVLYNIRRERRCELMGEGFRWDDLVRWRALDQLKEHPYFLHGCKIFGPMLEHYPKNKLLYDQQNETKNNVSSPKDVEGGLNGDPAYFSLFRISSSSKWYGKGMTWYMGHYLSPIAENHFLETSIDGKDKDSSPIYQNPYWSTVPNTGVEQ